MLRFIDCYIEFERQICTLSQSKSVKSVQNVQLRELAYDFLFVLISNIGIKVIVQ